MESVTFPSIVRPTGDNFVNPKTNVPGNSTKSEYEQKMDKLVALYFPTIDPNASVKSRLTALEETGNSQAQYNKQNHQTVAALGRHVDDVESTLKGIILSMQADFDTNLAQLKKEYDHRFDLQASENKRLQNHVATLKADTNQLKRKMQSTIEKLRKLQHEFGDPDDVDEESSVLFTPHASLTLPGSRPHTGGY